MNRELTLEDARLAARLTTTLNRAAELQADPAWDARMEGILAQARKPTRTRRWHLSGGLAIAASVAFMLALPSDWLQQIPTTSTQAQGRHVDGQMVDEIDWLMSMEAVSRAGR